MMHSNQTDFIPEVTSAPESYPTFWEAIPVDSPVKTSEETQATSVMTLPPSDAYAEFLALSEEGPASSLHVEQTDVG